MIEQDGETIRIYQSRLRSIVGLLGCAAMAAGGYQAYKAGWATKAEWLNGAIWAVMILGGLGVLLTFAQVIRPRLLLQVDRNGVRASNGITPSQFLPWSHVQNVKMIDLPGSRMIGVEIRGEHRNAYTSLASVSAEVFGCQMLIQHVNLPGDKQLLELITERWQQAVKTEQAGVPGPD